jgi:hypothetical protein
MHMQVWPWQPVKQMHGNIRLRVAADSMPQHDWTADLRGPSMRASAPTNHWMSMLVNLPALKKSSTNAGSSSVFLHMTRAF